MSEIAKVIQLNARLERQRHYECVVVVNPNVNDADLKTFVEKVKKTLAESKGTLLRFDDWGKKRLPHIMDKHMVANFLYIRFVAQRDSVLALERILKIDTLVLRYLTVVLSAPLSATDIQGLVERAPREPSSAPSLRGDDDEFSMDASFNG